MASAGLAGCRTTAAPAQERIFKLVYLVPGDPALISPSGPLPALKKHLAVFGYHEGWNLVIEVRGGYDHPERLPEVAEEIVGLRPDVVVISNPSPILPMMRATQTIPIVFVSVVDPVAEGVVPNEARPGGNVTGIASHGGQTSAKIADIFVTVIPSVRKVAVAVGRTTTVAYKATVLSLSSLGVEAMPLELGVPDSWRTALPRAVADGAEAIIHLPGVAGGFGSADAPFFQALFATGLPTAHFSPTYVEAGGLFSYAQDFDEQYRRLSEYVAFILKGARPGQMPVDLPNRFQLVINMRRANALGLTIPQGVLREATRILQ